MTDARILRTRSALHAAIIDLASSKPVGEVTVSELADRAGINRVTFYKHYTTPAEALSAALLEELNAAHADLPDPSGSSDAFALSLTTGLDHIDQRRSLYTIAFSDTIDGTVPMMFGKFLTEISLTYLTKRRKRKPSLPDIDLDVAAAYLASGAVGAIHVWILEGDMSRERIFENLQHLVPSWFISAENPS